MKIHSKTAAIFGVLMIAGWATVSPVEARRLNFMDGIGYQQRLKESREAYSAAWAAQYQHPAPVPVKRSTKKKRSGAPR